MADGLVWRVKGSFTHMSGTVAKMPGKLHSAGTTNGRPSTWFSRMAAPRKTELLVGKASTKQVLWKTESGSSQSLEATQCHVRHCWLVGKFQHSPRRGHGPEPSIEEAEENLQAFFEVPPKMAPETVAGRTQTHWLPQQILRGCPPRSPGWHAGF